MSAYSDFVDRLLIRHRLGDLLRRIHVREGSEWEIKSRIDQASDDLMLGGGRIADPAMVHCVRAGLYYLYDDLGPARDVIKMQTDPMSCYWMAMIYRRENEVSLARQLLDRIYFNPCANAIHRRVGEKYDLYARQLNWDPYLFLNQCEQLKFGMVELEPELRDIQNIEWTVCFEYCWNQALEA
ncbi:MAG: hypothetical protein SFY92_00525 [Verrucomicrobiae bacterium]|nr:hypothetical protein [Verrucomicrobiae bacterium]